MGIHKLVGRLLKYGTLLSTWCLIITVLLQVVCRFSWLETPSWTEEASRILFIYSISFAAGLALKNGYYVHLEMFYQRLNPKIQRVLDRLIPWVSLMLFGTMALYSVKLILLGLPEKSPSMRMNMGLAFFSMLVMSGAIFYYLVSAIIKRFKKPKA